MAEAALAQAAVDDKNAENNKERNKLDKLTAYIQLFNKDTSGYDEDTLGRHKQVLDLLAKELFPWKAQFVEVAFNICIVLVEVAYHVMLWPAFPYICIVLLCQFIIYLWRTLESEYHFC